MEERKERGAMSFNSRESRSGKTTGRVGISTFLLFELLMRSLIGL
jgi:hypothetical protein